MRLAESKDKGAYPIKPPTDPLKYLRLWTFIANGDACCEIRFLGSGVVDCKTKYCYAHQILTQDFNR